MLSCVEQNEGRLLFVYVHGGTGKTYLWQTITAVFRAQGKVVLTVASSSTGSSVLTLSLLHRKVLVLIILEEAPSLVGFERPRHKTAGSFYLLSL